MTVQNQNTRCFPVHFLRFCGSPLLLEESKFQLSFDPAVKILKLCKEQEDITYFELLSLSLAFFSVDMRGFLSLVSVKLVLYCDCDFHIYFCGQTNIFTKPGKIFPDTV